MPTPLDAERARLRAEGHTDAEISQILIAREVARSAPQAGGSAPVQGNMTGVLANASAVLSHVRGIVPAIKADAANVLNPNAAPASRTKSAAVLVGVSVVVAALGYALYLEWQIHIVYGLVKAEGDAGQSAAQARAMSSNIDEMVAEMRKTETPEAKARRIHEACLKTEYKVQLFAARDSGQLEKFDPTNVKAACDMKAPLLAARPGRP